MVPSPWQTSFSCLCPQSSCLPFRSGCLSPSSIDIYCLELPQEFFEVHKIAVHVVACLVFSLIQICLCPCCVVWTLRWWSAHPWKCCLLLCMKHACLFCNSFRCNEGPIPVAPCPHWNWESNCCCFWLRLNFMLPTLDPPFYSMEGSSGIELLHKHHRFV